MHQSFFTLDTDAAAARSIHLGAHERAAVLASDLLGVQGSLYFGCEQDAGGAVVVTVHSGDYHDSPVQGRVMVTPTGAAAAL